MTEATLAEILFQNLKKGGIKKIARPGKKNKVCFHREIGTSSFRADIFISLARGLDHTDLFNSNRINFIAIEVKIKDWRQGLYQAWKYNSFAEKSYLAIYEKYARDIDVKMFERYNVGLIVFNKKEIFVKNKPKNNSFAKEDYSIELREHLWQRLEKVNFQMQPTRHR